MSRQLFQTAIAQLKEDHDISAEMMSQLVKSMMEGDFEEQQAADLLTQLYHKGESIGELVGAARSLRECMTPIVSNRQKIIDTCGTGGSGANTFNISTAVAIVAAAAGAVVAKHGNKKSTSRSGSSDVLEVLGVNVMAPIEVVAGCLEELGLCFCFAPLFHPSVRRITGVRRQLLFPTIFNLLGPLCNPAGAGYQLLGAGRRETQSLIAGALRELGTTRAWVVHGDPGIGELSISGISQVEEVIGDDLRGFEVNAETFGLTSVPIDLLTVASPEESAARIREVLDGVHGPHRDVVLLNVAAALQVVDLARDFPEGIALARQAIDSGAAKDKLAKLVRFSQQA